MSIIKPGDGYPKLMKSTEDDREFIIIIYELGNEGYKGMVLKSSDNEYPVGTYCDAWNRRTFKEMTHE